MGSHLSRLWGALVALVFVFIYAPCATAATGLETSDAEAAALLQFFRERKWAALGAGATIIVLRYVKADTKPTWLFITAKRRIFLVWGLTLAGMLLERISLGVTWQAAVTDLLTALVLSVVLFHQTYIAAYREGRELPVPGVIPGERPAPTAPITVPATPAPDVVLEPIDSPTPLARDSDDKQTSNID